jgi:hypothetical protein
MLSILETGWCMLVSGPGMLSLLRAVVPARLPYVS